MPRRVLSTDVPAIFAPEGSRGCLGGLPRRRNFGDQYKGAAGGSTGSNATRVLEELMLAGVSIMIRQQPILTPMSRLHRIR